MSWIRITVSLLVAAAFCCAKKTDSFFQKGNILKPLSRIELKSAEIAAYMPDAKMLFTVGDENSMEAVSLKDAKSPVRMGNFLLEGEATSVAVFDNLIAVSLLGNPDWGEGSVEIMEYENGTIRRLQTHKVCFHPDMLTFTPDGRKILVACEGEPSDDGRDPFGAVGILDVASALGGASALTVLPFDDVTIEPEYITVSDDSKWAWVSLQENNALAKVDLTLNKIADIYDLGYVDHSKPGFELDAVKDGEINIKNENLWGLRQPDGIKTFNADGVHYVLTANEGEEIAELKKFWGLQDVANRAKKKGFNLSFGTRSISLFDGGNGKLLWDSGSTFERVVAEVAPDYFNWNSKKGKRKVDARSNDKGCEPENVTVGYVKNPDGTLRRLVFVGLERMSGIAVFDFSDLKNPKLVDYIMDVADRGPEGVLFIDAENSPLPGQALLVVGYEYSETLVIYEIK